MGLWVLRTTSHLRMGVAYHKSFAIAAAVAACGIGGGNVQGGHGGIGGRDGLGPHELLHRERPVHRSALAKRQPATRNPFDNAVVTHSLLTIDSSVRVFECFFFDEASGIWDLGSGIWDAFTTSNC